MWSTVLLTHPGPIPVGVGLGMRHNLVVRLSNARELGRFTQTAVAGLMQAGVPSERFVSSAIQPSLAMSNLPALTNLTANIMQGWEYYDNSTLYAKLWHYVLLRDFFVTIGQEPLALVFPQIDVTTWINLADPNLDINAIPSAITRRDLILIEDKDIFPINADLHMVYLICKAGARYDGILNHETP